MIHSKLIKISLFAFAFQSINVNAQSNLYVSGSAGANLYIGNSLTVQAEGSTTIASGATFSLQNGGNPDFRLKGNLTNNGGTFTCGTSTVTFNGSTNQTSSALTYHNLTLNNGTIPSTSAATLAGNINVGGALTLTTGVLNTSTFTVDLGANGSISENNPSAIAPASYVTGYVKATRNTGSTSGTVTFGGIGLQLTETTQTNNSTVVIRRTGTASVGAGNNSILRYFDITPTVDAGLNGSIVFSYTTAELSGQSEDSLKIYKSSDGGTTWSKQTTTVNVAANTLSTSGITSFSRWTASNKVSAPLPVEFLYFNAKMKDKVVELTWQTATEVNNDYFVIERSLNSKDWVAINTVDGAGNSNSPLNYMFIDENPLLGVSYYRLKQVDYDQKVSYSSNAVVNFEGFEIVELFPNPSKGNFNLVMKSSIEAEIDLTIYNSIGQVVKNQHMQVTKGVNSLNAQFEGATGKYLITVKSTDGQYYDYTLVLNK